MTINSRQKGARAERALAKKLREWGFDTRRGVQYSGLTGQPDIVGMPYLHLECKHVERLNIHDAMAQSVRDAREGETPVVMHKKNNTEWLVTLRLDDFIPIYREWMLGNDLVDGAGNGER